MKKISVLVLGLLVLLAGCTASKELDGNWTTEALEKDGVAQTIAVSNIEFTTKGNVVNAGGCAGVNLFNGDVKVSNGKISTGTLAVTKMMGEPAAMEFEDLFIEVLNNADSYKVENNVLTITATSKNLKLVLRKAN